MSFQPFIDKYIKTLHNTLLQLDFDALNAFQKLLKELPKQGKVYVIGNGGSAASHMANDFGIGLKRRDKLSINVVSLSDNVAVCSAIANDTGYENVFYLQLKDIIKPEDVVVAISCSGNSENIIKAVSYAKEEGSTVVALSGFDGGKLHQYADIILHAASNKGDYGIVEDAHMIINHLLYSWFLLDE